jgi:alpha-glucosidase
MSKRTWWQKAVFYQVYPRSFADANGDGIGDLQGMLNRLDYLQDLGIDAVWLSPHYPSPLWDCGYDISDYTAVAPEYGTLDDFRQLLEGLHRRGMRLLLDLVLNHTSDQHPWFLASRSNRDHPKRDWYIWRDGKNGNPPNNWYSTFGGSAWELDDATGQYYYHYFFNQQPDLNWRNPQVRQAMWDAVRFWLDLGVDGFRLDAIGTIFEHPNLPDQRAPVTLSELYRLTRTVSTAADRARVIKLGQQMFGDQRDLPEVHELMRELRSVVDEYPDRVLIGETDVIDFYGDGQDELHMIFNFPLLRTRQLTPAWIAANQELRLAALPVDAWPCNTLGNHDAPRLITQFGDGIHDQALARLHLGLVLTLKGTPFLYNGEEIGMTDLMLDDLDQFRDMLGVWAYHTEIEKLGSSPNAALAYAARHTRDKCRTPMQWSNQANGGFSPPGVTPWLPVNPNYAEGVNVEDQAEDPESLLHFYRTLLHLRKATPALVEGEYSPLHGPPHHTAASHTAARPELDEAPGYFAFLRTIPGGQECLVILNFQDQAQQIAFELPAYREACLVFSTRVRESNIDSLREVFVGPFEFLIVEIRQ